MNSGASLFAQPRRASVNARARSTSRSVMLGAADHPVQMSRAGARQANDEHGGDDPLLFYRRVPGALGFHTEQIFEQAHEQLAYRDAAERRQRRFVVVGLQQPLEGLGEVPRAESGRTGPAIRGATQAIGVERRGLHAEH
jgi:hypothetical protein